MDWVPIPSAPGYFANAEGHIKGRRGKILRGTISYGYPRVSVHTGGSGRLICSHVLICEAFHGPKPSPLHEVAHGDGVRSNVCPGNLRWATPKENAADRVLHGTSPVGEKNPRAVVTEAQVAEIRLIYAQSMGVKYVKRGTRENLATRFGVGLDVIKHIVAGNTWRRVAIDLPFLPPPDQGGGCAR